MNLEIGDLIECGCCPARGIIVALDYEGRIKVINADRAPLDEHDYDLFHYQGVKILKKSVKRFKPKIINEPDMEGD